jgi:hypothetical protein
MNNHARPLNAIRVVWQLRIDRLSLSLCYVLVPIDLDTKGVRVYSSLLCFAHHWRFELRDPENWQPLGLGLGNLTESGHKQIHLS